MSTALEIIDISKQKGEKLDWIRIYRRQINICNFINNLKWTYKMVKIWLFGLWFTVIYYSIFLYVWNIVKWKRNYVLMKHRWFVVGARKPGVRDKNVDSVYLVLCSEANRILRDVNIYSAEKLSHQVIQYCSLPRFTKTNWDSFPLTLTICVRGTSIILKSFLSDSNIQSGIRIMSLGKIVWNIS